MKPSPETADLPLPFLTADLPGVGGVIKRYNEDFLVEEIPLYPASGEGTHTFFTIEKQGLTTLTAVQMIARALGRPPRDIGYAGMKDAHGVTRQTLSVEHVPPERVQELSFNRLKVLSVTRHGNKLKLGHLSGNRFDLRIRDVRDERGAEQAARRTLEVLERRGVPNYFGPQRFGARGDNAAVGRAILLGDYAEALALLLGRPGPADHGEVRRARELFDAGNLEEAADTWPRAFGEQTRVCRAYARSNGNAAKAWRVVNHTLRKLYYSALQSELFNTVVAQRIIALDRVEAGDLAWKHSNGACFRVIDAEVEQPRCTALEISATGPLFGRRMTPAEGAPGEREAAVLSASGFTIDQFVFQEGTRFEGGRRPIRVPLVEPQVDSGEDERGHYVRVGFALASGAYATNVMREICK